MNQKDIAIEILILILGKENYERIIKSVIGEFSESEEYDTNDAEYIINSYIIAILVIGFSKKQINIDKYKIHLLDKPDINIDMEKFTKNYRQYIDEVENFKFDLLRALV